MTALPASTPCSSVRARRVFTAMALATVLAGFVTAQPNSNSVSASARDEVIALEKLVVTGTNIPTAADAMAVPITVLGANELAATGLDANLLEILRKRLPVFTGSNNLGNSNANLNNATTAAGSQVALRNFDTLVLINGRRVASSGANARGGNSFVDVNHIPLAALERVEVLTDGASAIYGSDAIGGVLNLILKSDYQGADIGGRYGVASGSGNYTERSFHATVGAAARGLHVTATGSYSKTAPLFQADRPFSHTINGRNATISGAVGEGTAFPRYFLNSALNSPRERNPVGAAATASSMAQLVANGTYLDLGAAAFTTIAATYDQAPYATLLLGQENRSAVVGASAELIGKKLVAFGDYTHTRTLGTMQIPAGGTTPTLTIPAGAPYNPTTGAVSQVAFRYLPNPRPFAWNSHLNRGVFGFRGALPGNWEWEVAQNWSEVWETLRVKNSLYGPNVDRAVAGGYNQQGVATPGGAFSRVLTGFTESSSTFVIQPALDPFARPAAVDTKSLENVLGTYGSGVSSKLASIDFKLTGRVLSLPAGKISVALGGDFRKESLAGAPDENARQTGPTAARWLASPLFDPFTKTRRIDAGFAEVRIPLTGEGWNFPGARALDLTSAYRVERYSDAGRSRSPKWGARWQPLDRQFALRGTYSEGFTAPPLFSLFGPVARVFTPAAVVPNVFGLAGQTQLQTGANPNLRPSTAKTTSLGLAVSPAVLKGLSVSVDFIHARQENLIGSVGVTTILQSVDQLGAASPYAAQVAFLDFPGEKNAQRVTRAGELGTFLRAGNSAYGIFVSDTRTNLAGQRVKAVDVAVDYALPTRKELGDFRLGTTGTFSLGYQFQALPTQAFYEYAGYTTNGGTGAQGTIPDYRFYSSASWRRGAWNVGVGHTYVPGVTDIGPGGITFATSTSLRRQPVASYSAWDLSAGYTVGAKTKAVGAWNFLRGMKVTVGVNNLGNRMPPFAPQAFNESNVDIAAYSVIGRLFYIDASVKF